MKKPTLKRLSFAVPLLAVAVGVVYYAVFHASFWSLTADPGLPALEITHPLEGAVMPRNMPPPVLVWKTNGMVVDRWAAGFQAGARKWLFDNIQPMWRPSEVVWRGIKAAANGAPIEVRVAGYEAEHRGRIRTRGARHFRVSSDTVEYPLFYREVNLPFIEAVKDPSRIRWRYGTLDKGTLPPVVLEKLPVCGNCHSFSRNGEYLAMDVDYANNKGSYVIAKTGKDMRLATSDIITWDDFRREDGEETLGLLSQISPDGRYVLSTVKDLSIFMPKPDLAFSQLFFPFMGIVGVYDREAKRFTSLPGADDPDLVQSNPTWSPDGQWVVFARTRAVKMKRAGDPGRLLFSGEEAEAFLRSTKEYRYDLYRVPFNAGKGGRAEPLRGAAMNGRSNYFPKYSPDGRWIVFCQASSYMLLQPDSELFIIPAEGGEARRLGCNLGRMNSWHSWCPDGRWIVFSSKAHSDYTQLYLAQVDHQGNASPPVWLAHMVEPGRAANIPEFVRLSADAIVRIREQFLDDLSFVRAGDEFNRAGESDGAVEKYRKALSLNPKNLRAHLQLGRLLFGTQNEKEAMEHLRAAVDLEPQDPFARFYLGSALRNRGDVSNAIVHLEIGLRGLRSEDDPRYRAADQKRSLPQALHYHLGLACRQTGSITNAEYHFREALRLMPDDHELHYNFGSLLLEAKRTAEAGDHFAEAVRLVPDFAAAHNGLGIALQRQNRRAEALACFQKAVQSDFNNWQAHLNVANCYLAQGERDKAIPELRETLRLKPGYKPAQQALARALGQSAPNAP